MPAAGSTTHVLVADDEPHIGRIIKMKLEQGPFRVTLAYDGREALDVLEREPDIGLVLLDLMMPPLSGLDVLAHIRTDPAWPPPQRSPLRCERSRRTSRRGTSSPSRGRPELRRRWRGPPIPSRGPTVAMP